MSNKPVLMIHEVAEWMFDLPLEDYVLTFDDGLYSQYYYYEQFKRFNTPKIYFISSDIVSDGIQSMEFPTCEVAHEHYREGDKTDYMTVNQIRELMLDPLVSIGGHSHTHTPISKTMKLIESYQHLNLDTNRMLEWFDANLGIRPTKFCFPYNYDWQGLYKKLLEGYGFTEFYGSERIAIESLR